MLRLLNQGRGLSTFPKERTPAPNYPLKHARSGSDSVAASTSPVSSRPRHSRPLQYYSDFHEGFAGRQAHQNSAVIIHRLP